MSRWLYRANWFAAYARDTLAAAKAWPLSRPSGIAKRCLKELLFEDAHTSCRMPLVRQAATISRRPPIK